MDKVSREPDSIKALAAAVVAAVLLVGLSLPIMAAQVDARSREREAGLVGQGLDQLEQALVARQGPAANWDEAMEHVQAPSIDPAWMINSYGDPSGRDVGSRLIAVLGPEGEVRFAMRRDAPIGEAQRRALEVAARDLVARLHAAEAARDRRGPRRWPARASDYLHATSNVMLDGSLHQLVGDVMGSDSGRLAREGRHAPILIYGSNYTTDILPTLTRRLLLADLKVTTADGGAERQARLPLRDASGRTTAFLSWSPQRPGTRLMYDLLVPMLAGACAILAAAMLALRRGLAGARALKASEAQARRLAFHDQLTGLANRRSLLEQLAGALATAEARDGSAALLLIDLDRFKFINDTYGHQSGDDLLKAVAARLTASVRPQDLCARLGGDEFVVLCPDGDAAVAAAVAQRILTSLAQPVVGTQATLHTAGSIGIAVCTGSHAGVDDVMRQADLALYRVKQAGRNGFCFFETEMDQAVRSRRSLETDLRDALADGDIHVVYQPQFGRDRMTGVEALARWTHPVRGAVPPSVFIPLAEECGLIEALSLQVIRRAFEDSFRWAHLQVAINLSPAQLKAPSFLLNLQLMMEELRIAPERFEFELKEGALLADDFHSQSSLAALRNLGFGLVLDDFGAGSAGLFHLRSFPVEKIKIDRAFIAGVVDDPVCDAIVEAVVRLGATLGLAVMAEGVETEAQRARLADLGCDGWQGLLTGPPATADEIVAPAREAAPGGALPTSWW